MTVYVTTQGAHIIREGRHLLVKKGGDTYHTLFIYKLEQLIVMGNVIITPQAMKLLLRENVDTVFLRLDGRYLGRLACSEQKNVFLRRRQFVLSDDAGFCLEVAKSIVAGKMANMTTVLQRIQRTRNARKAGDAADAVRRLLKKVPEAESLETVRGLEGGASAAYFAGLRHGLDRDMGFTRRVRRPPTDPVNSVLSLLYTFIINRAYAAIRIAGLDPYPGMLHSLEYGRHSLPLDLVEEFRPILADTLTLSLFNLGVLKEDDFYRVLPPQEKERDDSGDCIDRACHDSIGRMGMEQDDDVFDLPPQVMDEGDVEVENGGGRLAVKLYQPAFIRVIKAFEKKIGTEFFHPLAEKRLSYGEAMVFQARQMRLVIEGEVHRYQPMLLK